MTFLKFLIFAFLFFTKITSYAQGTNNFQVAFICNTQSSGNEYAHEAIATNMLRTMALNPNLFPQMISQDRDCKLSDQVVKNLELLEKEGKVMFRRGGKQFILLKIGKFATAGIVGPD